MGDLPPAAPSGGTMPRRTASPAGRRVRAALDSAARGQLRPCLEALDGLDAGDAAVPALTAASWFAGLPHGAPADLAELADHAASADPVAAELAAAALPLASRARLLAFDAAGLATIDDLARRLVGEGVMDPLEGRRLAIRRAVLAERARPEAIADLEKQARRAGVAEVVVEAPALAALCELARGEAAVALDLARRSVRMARTEGLRQEHYFAGLVLARVRRSAGHPHLASHILATLARVASAPWSGWIGWEQALAAGVAPSPEGPGRWLVELAQAYEAADGARVEAATTSLEASLPAGTWAHRDWRTVAALLDPRLDGGEEVAAFRQSESHRVPHGVGELLADAPPLVYVVVGPHTERIGARGVALHVATPERRLARTARQQRVFTLLAVVAASSPAGLPEEEAFAETYGFSYERAVHQDVFNVLVHRARTTLGDHAELQRDEGMMRLVAHAPLALPDPRCEPLLDDRVLSLVSREGALGARQISSSLGVSLRSAQKALEGLVEDGACHRVKEGRAVAYTVEDTTFSEPTDLEALPG